MTTLKKFLTEIKDLNIHVIGASGTEGSEIALFLNKHQIKNVTLHDFSQTQEQFQKSFTNVHSKLEKSKADQKLQQLSSLSYKLNYKSNYLNQIESAELIFVPQSWYLYDQNKILFELKNKVQFSSLTKLYLQLSPCPIIGITGSNGKSTTTFLTYQILNKQNRKTLLTGNDRQASQILSSIEDLSTNDLIVTEISNRQLVETAPYSPHIAILTNITENHLSEHKDFQEYIDLKAKITKFQTEQDHFIYSPDNAICQSIAETSKAKKYTFGQSPSYNAHYDQKFIYLNGDPVIAIDQLSIKGEHNYQNITAAILAANICKMPLKEIGKSLSSFTGLPQRIEYIRTYKSLLFYDDRQGTALDATVQALKTLQKNPTTLIIGGQNKAKDITPLLEIIKNLSVKVIGIQSPFTTEIAEQIPSLIQVKSLTEAINTSLEISELNSNVLFSPACEYGPYFNPLEKHQDAEQFQEIVKNLK